MNALFQTLVSGLVLLLIAGLLYILTSRRNAQTQTAASFAARPLLNKSEARLYSILERWRRDHGRGLNLSTQVSYGAFLSAEKPAWQTIAAKHADFVFWRPDGYVRAIIEFDGDGHYGNSKVEATKVIERDRIKNQAALSANIPLIRIPSDATSEEIRSTLDEILGGHPGNPVLVSDADSKVPHAKTRGISQ